MGITDKTVQLAAVVVVGAVAVICIPYNQINLAGIAVGGLVGALSIRGATKTQETTKTDEENVQNISEADLASVVTPLASETEDAETTEETQTIPTFTEEQAQAIGAAMTAALTPKATATDASADETVNVEATPQA